MFVSSEFSHKCDKFEFRNNHHEFLASTCNCIELTGCTEIFQSIVLFFHQSNKINVSELSIPEVTIHRMFSSYSPKFYMTKFKYVSAKYGDPSL